MQRCYNPKHIAWLRYGGIGVMVCERWHAYINFLADMGRKTSPHHSIDRYLNPNGNYEPGNCRWATAKEQRANRRPYLSRVDKHAGAALELRTNGLTYHTIAVKLGISTTSVFYLIKYGKGVRPAAPGRSTMF
jgi:hypothetical protein